MVGNGIPMLNDKSNVGSAGIGSENVNGNGRSSASVGRAIPMSNEKSKLGNVGIGRANVGGNGSDTSTIGRLQLLKAPSSSVNLEPPSVLILQSEPSLSRAAARPRR